LGVLKVRYSVWLFIVSSVAEPPSRLGGAVEAY
jgi:hypothetical protein